MNLSPDQLSTLRHMLGINTPYDSKPRPTRNYIIVSSNSLKSKDFIELAQLEAIRSYKPHLGLGSPMYTYYCCTAKGEAAARISHKTIRKTKSQRRYYTYLGLIDIYPDLTFKEYLTSQEFRWTRDKV